MPRPTFQKGNKVGKQFSSTYQPKVKGRRPSFLKQLEKQYEISASDRKKWFAYLQTLTVTELEGIINDKSLQVWQSELARYVYRSVAKSDLSVFRELQDRFYGRAAESIDVTSKGESIKPDPVIVEVIDSRDKVAPPQEEEEQ